MKTQNIRITVSVMLMVAALGMGTAKAQQAIDGWARKTTGTSTNLRDICCLDVSTLIVCGDNGVILKSTDAGETWNHTHVEEGYKLLRMEMANSITGFCLGVDNLRNKALLKTLDGGETWTRVSSLPTTPCLHYDENNFRLFPVDTDTLYIWEPSNLLKSIDGGLSFVQIEPLDPASNEPLCRGMYFEDNVGFVLFSDYGKDGFTLSKTVDYGGSWTIVYTNNDYHNLCLILPSFMDRSNARVFAQYPTGILETNDGFETNSIILPSENYYDFKGCNFMECDMAFTSENMGCYISCDVLTNGIKYYHAYITHDNGNSWVCQIDNGLNPGKKLFAVDGVDSTFYIAAEHGLVYKREKNFQGTDEGYSPKVPLHPNPATGMVTLTGEGIREVEVHNLLGQRVTSMEGHDAESLSLSLEGLPEGVYLVSVRLADGKRCEKKLVVH